MHGTCGRDQSTQVYHGRYMAAFEPDSDNGTTSQTPPIPSRNYARVSPPCKSLDMSARQHSLHCRERARSATSVQRGRPLETVVIPLTLLQARHLLCTDSVLQPIKHQELSRPYKNPIVSLSRSASTLPASLYSPPKSPLPHSHNHSPPTHPNMHSQNLTVMFHIATFSLITTTTPPPSIQPTKCKKTPTYRPSQCN